MTNSRSAIFSVIAIFFIANAAAQDATFYTVSNKADGNTVVGYSKEKTGKYTLIGEFKTGGLGTGDLEIPALQKDDANPLANGDDPLISANAIAANNDRSRIVVVNPGNATISLMRINEDKTLEALSTAPTSDKFPVSVAISGAVVAVASVGDDNNNGSVSAFTIAGDAITPVDESRRDLKARPSTIAFSSDGEHVIVDELLTGKIKVFAVENGQLSETPTTEFNSPRAPETRFQAIPVGFVVRGDGGDDALLVSEARFLTPDFQLRQDAGNVIQSPLYSWQTGSLSTYSLSDNGQSLSLISGDVMTGDAIEGGEIANCWVALSKDGRHLYAANALSSSISRFDIGEDGKATLANVTAYKFPSEELFFSDLAVSRDGNELYQLIGNKGKVMIFDIKSNGDLLPKQTLSGLPVLGAYGMLVY